MDLLKLLLVFQCCILLVNAKSPSKRKLEPKAVRESLESVPRRSIDTLKHVKVIRKKKSGLRKRIFAETEFQNAKLPKEMVKVKKEENVTNEKDKGHLKFGMVLKDTDASASSMHHRFSDDEDYFLDYEDTTVDKNPRKFPSFINIVPHPPTLVSRFSDPPSTVLTKSNSLTLSTVSTVSPLIDYTYDQAIADNSPLDNELAPSGQHSGSRNIFGNFLSNRDRGANSRQVISTQGGHFPNSLSSTRGFSSSKKAPSKFYGPPQGSGRPDSQIIIGRKRTSSNFSPRVPTILKISTPSRPRIQQPVHQPLQVEAGMPYQFEWQVLDAASGNDYSHKQISDGKVTQGQYDVLLPDGRRQIVVFRVDGNSGYQAEVRYEDEININAAIPPPAFVKGRGGGRGIGGSYQGRTG